MSQASKSTLFSLAVSTSNTVASGISSSQGRASAQSTVSPTAPPASRTVRSARPRALEAATRATAPDALPTAGRCISSPKLETHAHPLSLVRAHALLQAAFPDQGDMTMVITGRYASRYGVVALILALGLLLRGYYLHLHPYELPVGEAFRITTAFARTGTLGDPYLGHSGATAHLLPVPLLIGGLVYSLLGVASRPAEAVLSVWSLGLVFTTFCLTALTFRRAGAPIATSLVGLALCCGLPLNFGLEAVTFRLWEGGLAVAIAAGLVLALVTLDLARGAPSARATIALAVAAALLFLVSPQLGVAGYASTALLYLRRVPARRWPGALAVAALALAAVLAPWVVRNERVFGAPMLRSNLGLELAIAFHQAAVDTPDPRQVYIDRMRAVHPFASQQAFDRMVRSGGEVAYSRRLGSETRAWIAAHPASAARIGARHLWQYLFPPAWLFRAIDPAADRVIAFKSGAVWLLAALGLLGLARRLVAEPRSGFSYFAVLVIVAALPFMLVQPILRYRYLIYVPMTFYAADLGVWSLTLWPGTRMLVEAVERWWAGLHLQRQPVHPAAHIG